MDQNLKARLKTRLDGYLRLPVYQRHDETEIRIAPGAVPDVLRILHDSLDLRFEILADLAGVDTGEVMQIVYHLWSPMNSDWLRVFARDAVGDDPQPGGIHRAPEVIHDLHDLACVHAGEVGQDLKAQIQGVVEDPEYVRHGPRSNANLGFVVALVDRQPQVAVQ